MNNQRGFTYVELVTLILIVSLFGVAFVPGLSRARHKAMQRRCMSNLKQIGFALHLYAQAHQDTLPGPVCPVPQAGYDQISRQELAWYLAENLGYPKPSTNIVLARDLLCPAYGFPSSEPSSLATARTYVLNENISKERGVRVPPFGSLVQTPSAPLKLSALATYDSPFRIFATTDADKATVNPALSYWTDVPYRPVHGKTRNRLFFDGHVEVRSW